MDKYSSSGRIGSVLRAFAALGALTAATGFVTPAAGQIPDADRGRALYENHCIGCHTAQVHSRPNRIALTREEVRELVEHWRRQQNLTWSDQDTTDVVEFLGRSRYRYAPAIDRLSKP